MLNRMTTYQKLNRMKQKQKVKQSDNISNYIVVDIALSYQYLFKNFLSKDLKALKLTTWKLDSKSTINGNSRQTITRQ